MPTMTQKWAKVANRYKENDVPFRATQCGAQICICSFFSMNFRATKIPYSLQFKRF